MADMEFVTIACTIIIVITGRVPDGRAVIGTGLHRRRGGNGAQSERGMFKKCRYFCIHFIMKSLTGDLRRGTGAIKAESISVYIGTNHG